MYQTNNIWKSIIKIAIKFISICICEKFGDTHVESTQALFGRNGSSTKLTVIDKAFATLFSDKI